MAFTFTTLKTAIEDYTDNSESTFVSQLTRFILNAEERILKECQLDVFRKNVAGSLTASNKFLSSFSNLLFSSAAIASWERTLCKKYPQAVATSKLPSGRQNLRCATTHSQC